MVEEARLESVYTRKGIKGSNPFSSASPDFMRNYVSAVDEVPVYSTKTNIFSAFRVVISATSSTETSFTSDSLVAMIFK